MTDRTFTGVWLSSEPLDANEGAWGEVLLAMEIPDAVFVEYEWVEAGKTHREALVPASILNRLGQPSIVESDD
jgi:hypothetical protein